MDGYVDFWHQSRGYGFIYSNDGRKFFAHISSFNPIPVTTPVCGTLVTFDEGRATKGPVALSIRIRHADAKIGELARVSSLGVHSEYTA